MSTRQASTPDADSKSARTRLRILDAAARVLSSKGYSGMRLGDVAELAEVQAPAIYYYFASREELVDEVMYAGIAQMREHLTTALERVPDGTPPMERLMVAVEEHLRHELELSDYASASIRNAGQVPESIRTRQLVESDAYGELWSAILKEAAKAGDLRADVDLPTAQMLVLGALNWTSEWWDPTRGSIDLLVENAKTFVRRGLEAPRK
jgi:AcrR family transcriptional regulator